ncbi:MAG: tRNA uridine-5-carboxymethylaminomethyl(34) synthesis GTPase MnmE [Epsilonproteobacteria bacterium]|nr:MAG: tRNA uridine-5-carboxymethylaminomethyl(34) synthesis GTPase MnmE [Campylobacterota bacterium]
MISEDTIVAIATAHGIGSISIVRLSGENSLSIAIQISKLTSLTPRIATLSKLYDKKNELIDEAILLYFKNPSSFTGEDIVEFQSHGGVAISNIILESCINFGARLANPGEFSKRAFLNGKIDLTQAQAISKMIEAKSEDAVKLLARQLKGELKDFVEDIRKDLLFMLAYTEVNIDYAEEDLPSDIYEQIEFKLNAIDIKLNTTLDASKRREGLIDGFKVAIVGKPNVGKSSLLNKLLNFNRAIVSDIAGTTRDTIEESVKIGTHIIKIVDTAGIREANDEIERIGIEKSIEAIEESDIIVGLFDSSREFNDEDSQIVELLNNCEKEKIIILNKSDLEQKFDVSNLKQNSHLLLNTKKDITPLLNEIENILNQNISGDEVTLISKQQILEVEQTIMHIQKSNEPLKTGELEFFAYHINEALKNISNITRPYEHSAMLDVMFGEFCLGK